MARHEGSPWKGLGTVWSKELADHLSSVRMQLLEVLIFLAAFGAVYVAGRELAATFAENPFAFLQLFTTGQDPLPSFVAFLGFFVPLVAISLGFDAINSEHNRRTLSLVLAQPIYRDAFLVGKFLGGLSMLALLLVALWLLTTGLGILVLGIPPNGEEVARGLAFLGVTLLYAGVWLALAMLFSLLFRQPATAALAALGVWIFLMVLWPMIAQLLAEAMRPVNLGLPQEQLAQFELRQLLDRLSPNTLYAESVQPLLHPDVRSLGPVFYGQLQGALMGSPLPLSQSLYLVWPQICALGATVVAVFSVAYLSFQRREIRA